MTKQLNIQKDNRQQASALWWKPVFSLQRELNNTMRETFSSFMQPSLIPASIWDVEDNIFSVFQRNTHRIFSEIFNNRQLSTPWLTGAMTEPYIDIMENGNAFKIKADVPGLNVKDLEVSISESAITIKGERSEETKEADDTYIRRECHCGAFSRIIALPEEADVDKASASFGRNVLTVEIPKKTEARSTGRRLKIEPAKIAEKQEIKVSAESEGDLGEEHSPKEIGKLPELVSSRNESAPATASPKPRETDSKVKKSRSA